MPPVWRATVNVSLAGGKRRVECLQERTRLGQNPPGVLLSLRPRFGATGQRNADWRTADTAPGARVPVVRGHGEFAHGTARVSVPPPAGQLRPRVIPHPGHRLRVGRGGARRVPAPARAPAASRSLLAALRRLPRGTRRLPHPRPRPPRGAVVHRPQRRHAPGLAPRAAAPPAICHRRPRRRNTAPAAVRWVVQGVLPRPAGRGRRAVRRRGDARPAGGLPAATRCPAPAERGARALVLRCALLPARPGARGHTGVLRQLAISGGPSPRTVHQERRA